LACSVLVYKDTLDLGPGKSFSLAANCGAVLFFHSDVVSKYIHARLSSLHALSRPFGLLAVIKSCMDNKPGSVVLIFRKIESRWREEHPLNLLAAFATRSQYSHVEISIGDEAGERGEIRNVVRIFNDDIGVEVAQRTGRSPAFHYVQLGCSLASERAMMGFAHEQVGKPFSMRAMMRSIVWPRKTDESSWFCAELVAATLQRGGLYPRDENPGAATPESLYRRFISQATTTGNPCTMRSILPNTTSASHVASRNPTAMQQRQEQMNPLIKHCNITLGGTLVQPGAPSRSRAPRTRDPPTVYSQPPHYQQSNQFNQFNQSTHTNTFQMAGTSVSAAHYSSAMGRSALVGHRPGCAQIQSPLHGGVTSGRNNAEEAIRQAVRRANIQQLSSNAQQHVVTLDIR